MSEAGCEHALELLQSPDADSRSKDYDGRRIERVNEGFFLLNYDRILREGAREERREYNREKKAEERAKKKANGGAIRPEHIGKKRGKKWDGLGGEQHDGARTMQPPVP